MTESQIYARVEERLFQIVKNRPIRVAINGIEGSGKTTLATGLTHSLNQTGRNAVHVSIDGFHFNKEHRYRQGRDSAIGYYEDSYDELAFVHQVLLSSQDNPSRIITATHNLETDEYLEQTPIEIPSNTILITDGAYLFKPNYVQHWDLKIYLKTKSEVALDRGAKRDAELLGSFAQAKAKFLSRYHRASEIYNQRVKPLDIADMILDNTDLNNWQIVD